jgi:hypothetical protein
VLVGRSPRYEIHSLELLGCDPAVLGPVAQACQAVEDRVWHAHEDFRSYLEKQTALFYAVDGTGETVAFACFDLTLREDTLVLAVNECMVVPEHQGQGLPNLFLALLISHLRFHWRSAGKRRRYKQVVAVSMTVNYKLMMGFKRYSFLTQSNPYRPCDEIREIAREYLADEGLEPVEAGNPFFAKAAFPGALKNHPAVRRPEGIPADFQPERGDAFLYVGKVSSFWALGLMAWLVQRSYGFKAVLRVHPFKRLKVRTCRDQRPVPYTKEG